MNQSGFGGRQGHSVGAKVAVIPSPARSFSSFPGGSSPCLCGQQLVVVGGALVVVLSVSDDRGQAFADQSFCDVTGRGERESGET